MEEKDEECGDTPADRLTHSLLMQTVPQRTSVNRRRQDSRECRCVCVCVTVMSVSSDYFLSRGTILILISFHKLDLILSSGECAAVNHSFWLCAFEPGSHNNKYVTLVLFILIPPCLMLIQLKVLFIHICCVSIQM